MTAVKAQLGTFIGARSGDKGGNANVGLWVIDPVESAAVALAHGGDQSLEPAAAQVAIADARFSWLTGLISDARVRELLPEAAHLPIDIHVFANLRAINLVIHGLLGRGVAETSRVDPQAKGLGEHLRARIVEIPAELLPVADRGFGEVTR